MRILQTAPSDPPVRPRSVGLHVRGLTLLECLVVLVVTSLLSSLVIQGFGFFLGHYQRVTRIGQASALALRQQHWFVSTVQGMVPSLHDRRRFKGEGGGFAGVTLHPLAAQPGRPVKVRWSIDTREGGSSVVVYREEGAVEWTVLNLPEAGLSFQYADEAGRWYDHWPVDPRSRQGIPSLLRLVSDSGRAVWLARPDLFSRPVTNFRDFS